MATPQITGAMAVLIEYLDKNYPDLTGAEQRKVAADLLMSTADPLMATSTLEYSPALWVQAWPTWSAPPPARLPVQ